MTVENIDEHDSIPDHSVPGAALALSGGGYRAMVFHAGALIRLNETGILPRLKMISSVSGGSITAGALAMAWQELAFNANGVGDLTPFLKLIRAVADTTIDAGAIAGGIFLPGDISSRVAATYDRLLFHGATLQALPDPDKGHPIFMINATSIQSAALFRFSRKRMGDYRIGIVADPVARLCDAVAASSAFPPVLSPAQLGITQPVAAKRGANLNRPPFTTHAVLGDGGIYDNMGLEQTKRYATVLVSDAGAKIAPEETPHTDWARHAIRVMDIIDNQVRSLRRRHLIDGYKRRALSGCFWGIHTDATTYPNQQDPLGVAGRDPSALAAIPTRLKAMSRELQDRLMNWGYAVCDAALRGHVTPAVQGQLGITVTSPQGFPFPGGY